VRAPPDLLFVPVPDSYIPAAPRGVTVARRHSRRIEAEVEINMKLSKVRAVSGTQAGQGLAEYALILALIAILAIAAITFMGGSINTMLSDLGNAM
jgi:Flp pilus assembly pilin Flp